MANGITNKKQIVILGGGVGGMEAAIPLARRSDVSVTVIDRSPCHVWKPVLHEFAAGLLPYAGNVFSFDALAKRFGFEFIQAEINQIERDQKKITLTNAKTLSYDYLVASVGARVNDFGTAGVAENCLVLDSFKDAENMHKRFCTLLHQAKESGDPLTVGIIGGGATGVQLAAALCSSVDTSPEFGPVLRKKILHPVIIEATPRILPAFPESVSEEAKAELERIGVKVLTSEMVSAVDETSIDLKSGQKIVAQLRVWAAGVQGSKATALFEGLEIARSNQLVVTPTLQTTQDPHILAIGDCSRLAENPVPPTAQVARQQGKYVGRVALPKLLENSVPPAFIYHDRGAVVALSGYNAWGMSPAKKPFGGSGLGACFAKMVHEGLYRQHQYEVGGLSHTLSETLRAHFSAPKPDLRATQS